MRSRYAVEQKIDLVAGRRVFNGCWLSASLGISISQMLLLAQAWHVSQQAIVPACMMSSWTLGTLVGARERNDPRIWGGSYLACTLLWLGPSAFVSWHAPLSKVLSVSVDIVALAMVALFLGASSTAWLSQQRAWPSVGERTMQVRSLVGLTVGLVVVWMLPSWAGFLALSCCLPLLALDSLAAGRGPLPTPDGGAAHWISRYWTGARWDLQLDERALPRNWWRSSPGERSHPPRGDLPLTLLASSVTVMLGGVCGAVPTPFAGGLRTTHTLEKLGWLLAGQLGILAVGTCFLLFTARGIIGWPDRRLPPSWHPRLRSLMLLMPVCMAGSLMALGLPFLQAPWWLALSLASYTLADAVWSILFPRLRPGRGTMVLSQPHLLAGQSVGRLSMLHLAYERACEARGNLVLAPSEGLLIAVITLVIGGMIDWHGSVDEVLVMVGLVFLLSLACILGGHALIVYTRRLAHARSDLTFHRSWSRSSMFPPVKTAADT